MRSSDGSNHDDAVTAPAMARHVFASYLASLPIPRNLHTRRMSPTRIRRTTVVRYSALSVLLTAAACSGVGRPGAGSARSVRAADAGGVARWRRESVPSTASCRSVSAVSALVAWVGCSTGRVFRTVDGGATWTVHTVPDAARLDFRGIKAFDANTAVITSAG